MTYGIIAALDYEEIQFRKEMGEYEVFDIIGTPAYKGKIGDNDVVVVRCGIGKVSAGVCAQSLIDKFSPDYIINIGCAGALSPELKIGDIVVSEAVVEWDLDLRAIGLPLGYIDALKCVEMKASKELMGKIYQVASAETKAVCGMVASGDQFVSTPEQHKAIKDNFPKAMCAEMEGAAIGHVARQNGIPFCILRAISDTADGNSGVDFNEFGAIAGKKSANMIIKMLKNL